MFTFFESLIQPFKSNSPERPPTTLWAFCRYFSRGSERYLAIMALLTATVAIIEILVFKLLGQIVDWFSMYSPDMFWEVNGNYLTWMSALILLGLPLTVLFHSSVLHQTLLGNFPMAIRWQAHRYLLSQSFSFYQDEFAGRIATKVMQTALAVREVVIKIIDVFLYSFTFFIGILIMSGSMDWRLTLPFLGWLVGYLSLLRYFVPRLQHISQRQADARSEMTGRIVDTYTNIATVKLFSHSQREANYAKDSMNIFLQTVYPQMRLVTKFIFSVWALNALLIFSVGASSVYLWGEGAVTIGAIAAAIGVVMRLYGMSQWIMWEMSSLFENIGTVHDGINTLSKTRDVRDTPNAPALQVHAGEIEFKDMSFHYGKLQSVINQFNLKIKAGEKIGLVGRSGAGKSTLVNLLLRFYDVEAGEIKIDSQDISQVQQESLRQQIGMVTQDTSLLHRSVRDNILYGRPDATEEELIDAARKAKAHDFILQLEDAKGRKGYDAHVGERGIKLSGGQRQRIAIARVLLKNAPILILDEATSALDSEVEVAIQENLNQLMQGKTVIAIAHRLSTIAALDRLIVLDKGQIIEEGSHQQLLDKHGLYAQLWAHQSGGFLGEELQTETVATD